MELYTKQELHKILNIPPSTVSYYIDRHPYFMTSKGSGRKKRYLRQTLEALKIIVEMSNNNSDKETIDNKLSSLFSKEYPIENTITAITTTEQQQRFIEVISKSLRILADQKKDIQKLKDDVEELKAYIKRNQLSWWQRLFKKE